jgi:hypothetical protein
MVIGLALWLWAPNAVADLRIESTIEVRTPTSCDSLSAVTYLKGPWLRREVWGTGALSRIFGKSIQIIDRRTGAACTLYPDLKRYTRDSLGPEACRPEAIVDLRFLGSVQAHAAATVSRPDTNIRLLGALARAVQLNVRPVSAAREGTRIRIWTTTDYDVLFGPDYAADLFCGAEDSSAAALGSLVLSWQEQFRLTQDDAGQMAKGLVGYPVKLESLYGPDSALLSSTTIQTTQVGLGDLSDSLFLPPPDFRDTAGDSVVGDSDLVSPAPGEKP